ncbi:H-2 class I histocompatibility antigen, Q9 alpha chain-like isoform X1 [Varanus komodoensis]|uniref:H-2 class I histocompatibility antigen, Q9 alpha chain-like isoform X1 n=1 Tax=Varanus komodoensis TaxID=61221 RepID=UPI001CF7AA4F|nr:H-2 class I histocompatibility antigen, Q9 alpha chain-like isoform X1 [Varanus komodoensis]XP_044288560.1 H-2 class I histocompatibility antigen, Q9 alpha chain-like isoform X1 [Varanus komodoensis]
MRAGPLRGPVLLVAAAAAAAFLLRGCCGVTSHSMRFFRTGVSNPSQGLPQFMVIGYLDDQPFLHYDSYSRRDRPKSSWIKKVEKDDANYWERNTQISWNAEQVFKVRLVNVPKYYNQSGGFHTWQELYGCELRGDGSTGGFDEYAYDGRTYLSFDKETLTWTAADAAAQITKRKLEAEPAIAQRQKSYLEGFCIESLRRHVGYGKEALQRKEPPVINVARKEDPDGTETLLCRAHGFYPKEIEIMWTRDGEVWAQDTFRGLVAPNSDRTYFTWLSIKIDPKDRGRYQCRVGHDSMQDPVGFVWKEPEVLASNLGVIIGCVAGGLILLAAVILSVYFYKKCQGGYQAASTSDRNSDSSEHGSNLAI